MAGPLTTREITLIIIGCTLSMSVSVFLLYRFFLAPVEERLRHWANALNYEFVRCTEPRFFDQLRSAWSWFWAPWGVWRVTVRDKAGLERVALVRLRALRTDPSPEDIRWEGEATDAPSSSH